MLRKSLLLCGILASVLYAATDVLAAVRYGGYHSFTDRVVSELMAKGAPTEHLVDPLFLVYGVLMLAFGVGVWRSSRRPPVHLMAGLLLAYAALGLLGPTVAEMNVRGTGDSSRDLWHIALSGALSAVLIVAVAVGAATRGRKFQLYSVITLLVMLAFGILTSFAARGLATGEPTPWIGLFERVDIGAFLLWVVVLAVAFWRVNPELETGVPPRERRIPPTMAARPF
jgi:hypothetical protein